MTAVPQGLSDQQLTALQRLCTFADDMSVGAVLEAVENHRAAAHREAEAGSAVNLDMAEALATSIRAALTKDDLDHEQISWLKGAGIYFVHSDDDEHDFASADGFVDDATIVNACLRHCGLGGLCVGQ